LIRLRIAWITPVNLTNHKIFRKMKKNLLFFIALIISHFAYSQLNMEVVGSELRGPIGIERDSDGNLWIAESGSGQNDGAVSVIWADGTQQRIIDALPSLFDTATSETLGPSRVQLFNDQYFGVLILGGIPELGSSILVYPRDSIVLGGAPLGVEDAANIIHLEERVLQLGFEESNGYSFVHDGKDLYIADAAANAIIHRDGLTGVIQPFATFPPSVNPLPFGPPFIDAVPTRIIHNPDGGFYVSQLTGFPFIDGASKIFSVDTTGQVGVVDSGLTLVTDLATAADGDGLIALQFASFRLDSTPPFVIGSGQIIQIHEDGTKDTLASGFGPSPGLVVAGTNEFYVTNLFFGTVVKLSQTSTSAHDVQNNQTSGLHIAPNPANAQFTVQWYQPAGGEVTLKVAGMDGKIITNRKLGYFAEGNQTTTLDRESLGLQHVPVQNLAIGLTSGKMFYSALMVLGE
jgi:hypothetical protein